MGSQRAATQLSNLASHEYTLVCIKQINKDLRVAQGPYSTSDGDLGKSLKKNRYTYVCISIYIYIYREREREREREARELFYHCATPGEGNGNSSQYSCLENSLDRGSWQAIVHGVAEFDVTKNTHAHIYMYT